MKNKVCDFEGCNNSAKGTLKISSRLGFLGKMKFSVDTCKTCRDKYNNGATIKAELASKGIFRECKSICFEEKPERFT